MKTRYIMILGILCLSPLSCKARKSTTSNALDSGTSVGEKTGIACKWPATELSDGPIFMTCFQGDTVFKFSKLLEEKWYLGGGYRYLEQVCFRNVEELSSWTPMYAVQLELTDEKFEVLNGAMITSLKGEVWKESFYEIKVGQRDNNGMRQGHYYIGPKNDRSAVPVTCVESAK